MSHLHTILNTKNSKLKNSVAYFAVYSMKIVHVDTYTAFDVNTIFHFVTMAWMIKKIDRFFEMEKQKQKTAIILTYNANDSGEHNKRS